MTVSNQEHIKEIIEDLFPEAKSASDGKEIVFNCPECGKTMHFYFNLRKEVGHCFKCGYIATFKELCKGRKYSIPKVFSKRDLEENLRKDPVSLPKEYISFSDRRGRGMMWNKAIAFLHRRGIKEKTIEEYKLGFCQEGRYFGRIIIPIFENGECVYFVARTFLNHSKRYLNPLGKGNDYGKSDVIFGLDKASDFSNCKIVEGVFDAMSNGLDYIALLGKQLSDQQKKKIIEKRFESITVILDGDAKKDALEIASALFPYTKIKIFFLPEKSDPDTYENLNLEIKKLDFLRRDQLDRLKIVYSMK